MTNLKKRDNEYNYVFNRDKFEDCPPDIDPVLWDRFRQDYNKAAELKINPAPPQLNIELNSKCNQHCNFCVHSVRRVPKMFLGFDNYKSLIDQAVSMGTLSVKLNNMNEPLLLPDIERYIRYAKDQGIVNIFFSTNGTLLTAEKSRMLIDSGLTKLFISIDAVTPETYYAQRGSTRFNTVVRNVNQFIDIRNESGKSYPLVRVNFLKNKLNLHEVDQFLEYWKNRADIVIFQEMYERVDKKSDLMITDKKTEFRCSFPFKLMAVRSNSDILPCCTMHGQRMVVGNISEMSLIDAWNSKLMNQLRKIHINGDFEKFPICNYCVNGV